MASVIQSIPMTGREILPLFIQQVLLEDLFKDYWEDKGVVDMLRANRYLGMRIHDLEYYAKKFDVSDKYELYRSYKSGIALPFDLREQSIITQAAQHWWKYNVSSNDIIHYSSKAGLINYIKARRLAVTRPNMLRETLVSRARDAAYQDLSRFDDMINTIKDKSELDITYIITGVRS